MASNNPRPNLPSLLDAPKPQSESSGGIRLPPISFLSNLPQMSGQQSALGVNRLLNDALPQPNTLPSLQPMMGGSNSASSASKSPLHGKAFPFASGTAQSPPIPFKEDITKPEVESESDDDIIKYYETKYGINDFTAEEKHDILQHERRARIEKQKNPQYKTFLCYSIIKRLNNTKGITEGKKPESDGASRGQETDEAIIKRTVEQHGFDDYTDAEKEEIISHERRMSVLKSENPGFKPFPAYSVIKRHNQMGGYQGGAVKKERTESQPSLPPMHPMHPMQAMPPMRPMQPSSAESDQSPLQPSNQYVNGSTNGDASVTLQHQPTTSSSESLVTSGNVSLPEQPQGPRVKFTIKPTIINNEDVLTYASKFPRKHLGSLLYNPFPTKSTYKQLQLFRDLEVSEEEDKKLVPLLPELRDHINSIVTVRIPSWQITDLQNNKSYEDRAIWGTDIYTDDSDVLLILKHNGFLPQVDPDVEGEEKTMEKRTPGNKDDISNITQTVSNFRQFVNIIGGDVHVDLIVLPPLVEYSGVFRNGINSRPWKRHDGMSIAVYGVRYGEKGSAVESMNDISLKKRKLDELEELRSSEVPHQGKWKLNKEAWKKAKMEMELEKSMSKKSGVENKDADETVEVENK